eukprot:11155406-Lingulodinium_polyedra.AAC.1
MSANRLPGAQRVAFVFAKSVWAPGSLLADIQVCAVWVCTGLRAPVLRVAQVTSPLPDLPVPASGWQPIARLSGLH